MPDRVTVRHLSRQLKRLIGAERFASLSKNFPHFNIRRYQVLAVQRVIRQLKSRRNVLFLLDPGLGKTLVCQLCFLGLIDSMPRTKSKSLVLVPSRLLRDQHFRAAGWFSLGSNILRIDSFCARYPTQLRKSFCKANWIITTPKLLSNAIIRDYGLRLLLKQVHVCVVDEFDAQATEDVDSQGEPIGRFSEAGHNLVVELAYNKTIFLCMSATQRAAAAPWLEMFKMNRIDLPTGLLQKYSAYARVRLTAVKDKEVIQADEIISLVVLDTLRKIRHKLTGDFLTDPEIDPHRLYQQASRVFAGKRHKIFFPDPVGVNIDVNANSEIMSLLGRFLQAYAERLALYEGRMAEVSFETYQRKARVNQTGALVEVESVSNVSYSNSPTANGKITALRAILSGRRNERSLVLTRNTDVNHFISRILNDYGFVTASITGTMSDGNRRKSLEQFENGKAKILIVNRQIGGRGFDLPIARFAVFLSPKRSEETMWQEMLRIRSSHIDPKDVYILYFSQTKEEEKTISLLEGMQKFNQRYEIQMAKNLPAT
jgi:superfamily II DNA or RNA helicase